MTNTIFNERELAFEAKYGHEVELDFLTKTRGGAMFAQWVASLLKLDGDEAMRYTHQLIESIVLGQSHDDMLKQVAVDLSNAGQALPRRALEARVTECNNTARAALY